MAEVGKHHRWAETLRVFSESNKGRPTRLGAIENGDDLWLESGLKLEGVDLEEKGDFPTIQIFLDGYTRTVNSVRDMSFKFGRGDEDGMDLIDINGNSTILRFEIEAEKELDRMEVGEEEEAEE
jgi:hypothetical protein